MEVEAGRTKIAESIQHLDSWSIKIIVSIKFQVNQVQY